MKRNPFIAGILSLLVPGLGQIYGGEGNKGAAIMAAAIVIGNLNIIILPLISMANPVIPTEVSGSRMGWAYWIPRIVHDVMSFWSITFWGWAVVDAMSRSPSVPPFGPSRDPGERETRDPGRARCRSS